MFISNYIFSIGAVTTENVPSEICAKRRFISDYANTAHSRSLIRIFTGRILDDQGCKVSSCEQRELSDLWGAHIRYVMAQTIYAFQNLRGAEQATNSISTCALHQSLTRYRLNIYIAKGDYSDLQVFQRGTKVKEKTAPSKVIFFS